MKKVFVKVFLESFLLGISIYLLEGSTEKVIVAILTFTIGLNLIDLASEILVERAHIPENSVKAFVMLIKIVGVGILISIITSILGANPSSAITFGSFAGLVVGMASQTVIKHITAGLFLLLFGTIKIGDNIKVKGIEGEVKEITFMHTIIDNNGEEILIPNGQIVEEVIRKKI